MSDPNAFIEASERPDPAEVAAYICDMAAEMEELADSAGLVAVAALLRATAHEAGRWHHRVTDRNAA